MTVTILCHRCHRCCYLLYSGPLSRCFVMSATADLLNGVVRSLRGFRIDETVHASRGGKAYPKEVRELVIQMILNGGIAAVKTHQVELLRHQHKFPSISTCRSWLRQYNALGHVRPYRRTGNRQSLREISDEALLHLAFYRTIRPWARIYEVKAYLTNRIGPLVPPFSDSQISRAEERLNLTRKKASQTAKLAYSTINNKPSEEEMLLGMCLSCWYCR